jgi:FkbM family methyltransferase
MTLFRIASRFLTATSRFFPKRWRLPLRYHALVSSRGVEPELTHLFSFCKQFRCAVDVGANHGFYTYKMAQRFGLVVAFEANPTEDFDLWHYPNPNVQVFRCGLSSVNETRVLHVPVRQGIPVAGWASVGRRELPFADAFLEIPVEVQCLDDQPFVQNHTIDLIKIDVEGHELEVLQGGIETIRRDNPVLLIEDNPEQREAIRELLEGVGYRSVTFAEISGKSLPSPNLIWTAKEL